MDENKQQALWEMSYHIDPCCGLCRHGAFPNNDWGTCQMSYYVHLKHSETEANPERHVSIHKMGACPSFEASAPKLYQLGAFSQYWKGF